MSNWYQTAVFYELYIRAYADSNGDGHGDLRGLIGKLDYIQSLGVDCIWVLPHYPSPLKDDGYDVADYRRVHPDYGNLADFKTFVDAAHERGLRVITDLVMNHTSDQHRWFQEARKDKNSPYRDYYVWSDTGEEYKDIRLVFPDFEDSNWEWDEVAGQYYWHRFFRSQPDLNFDNPKVHEEMLDIVRFWLDMGVDGFRLDAVIYLYEREGTDGAGLPETHEFIRKVRKLMDDEYSEKVMIAEANDMPAKLFDYFGEDDECHMCFHFPIMPRFYLSLLVGNKMPLVNIIRDTPTLFPKSQWLTFLRNHDELTLEMVTDDEAKLLYRHFAPQPGMKINNGIRRRLAPLLSNHKGRWLMLNAMLMSLVGTPIIYYGDEIGMGDNIDLPDRHGVRTAMQWNDGKNGGFSTADDTYFPVNSDDEYGYKWVNVAKQENDPNSYLNATRYLLTARKQHPELQQGTLTIWDNDDPQVFGYWREWQGERTLCVYNLSAEVHSVSVHLPDVKGQLVDLLHEGTSYMLTGWSPLVVKMRPFGSHWLYVSQTNE